MALAEALLSIVNEGLKFLNAKEATRIQEKVMALRENYLDELSKGSMRDDALLDMYERELLDISGLFLASLKGTSPSGK
jgi:hypothetical protein